MDISERKKIVANAMNAAKNRTACNANFKVGDRVKYNSPSERDFHGAVGTVLSIGRDTHGDVAYVEFDNGMEDAVPVAKLVKNSRTVRNSGTDYYITYKDGTKEHFHGFGVASLRQKCRGPMAQLHGGIKEIEDEYDNKVPIPNSVARKACNAFANPNFIPSIKSGVDGLATFLKERTDDMKSHAEYWLNSDIGGRIKTLNFKIDDAMKDPDADDNEKKVLADLKQKLQKHEADLKRVIQKFKAV